MHKYYFKFSRGPIFTCFPLLFLLQLLSSVGLAQEAIKKRSLSIHLSKGDLQIGGTTQTKVSYKVEKGKEHAIEFKEEGDKTELFVKDKTNLKKPLEISLPKQYSLDFKLASGTVSLSALESDIEGSLDSGSINISEVTGSLYLFNEKGNVTLRKGEATGSVGSGQGVVLMEDIKGPLQGYSQQGTVKRKFTEDYASAYNEKLELSLEKTDLEIATILNKGADLYLSQGNLSIGSASGSLLINANTGNIEIASLRSSLSALVENGNMDLVVTQSPAKQELNLSAKEGNITLTLPSSFSGQVYVEQLATGINKATYRFESDFNLGIISKEAIKNEQGDILAYQTIINQGLGNGNASLTIRLTNGNLSILKSTP